MGAIYTILEVIGSTLLTMILSLMTGQAIRSFIITALEHYVSRYERSAATTTDKEDDERAKTARKILNVAEESWRVKA